MEGRKQQRFTSVLFVIYVAAVVWIILFKLQFSLKGLNSSREINLIPFAGSMIINGRLDFKEIIENILIFVPMGIYISMLRPRWQLWKKIAPAFLLSLILETLQYILAAGATDITDLIGNTLGGVIGIGIFYLFLKLFGKKTTKIINILASIGTTAMVGLIALLLVVNM